MFSYDKATALHAKFLEFYSAGKVAAAAGLAHAGTLDTGTLVWIRDRPGR